jgi:serine O-acetyltransferase
MKYSKYKYLILSDLYRISGKTSFQSFLRQVLFGESYKYIFWMRTCNFTHGTPWLKYSLYPLAFLMYQHYTYKFGIVIQFTTEIGPGFYIGHFGCIFIYPYCKIGRNCNLSQGVTLGKANRGKNMGYPIIGDNVYIGPGAKVVGAVRVGNNVAIGANCVVTKNVPDNAVVVGIPGKVISDDGSKGYMDHTDYESDLISINY